MEYIAITSRQKPTGVKEKQMTFTNQIMLILSKNVHIYSGTRRLNISLILVNFCMPKSIKLEFNIEIIYVFIENIV